jgi:tRNA 2-thiouridine synthesizing protein A
MRERQTGEVDGGRTIKCWEAGESGCGQLIVGLRHQLRQMPAGHTLQVIAFDAGASADLPAWCRMTGHQLISAKPPVYVIKK